MSDPFEQQVASASLGRLAAALDVVDERAELNHRYRKLITDSRAALAAPQVRLTQARGIGKKLLVLVKAAGPDFRSGLAEAEQAALDAGLAQANELIYEA